MYSRSVDKATGLRCDQTVRLTGVTSANDYPQYLRYVVSYDEENDKRLGFFTNNFELPALTIAQLQILSLTLFEKTPLDQPLNDAALQNLILSIPTS